MGGLTDLFSGKASPNDGILKPNKKRTHIQSHDWQEPITMNEMQLVLNKIAALEALWRTSERLTPSCINHGEKGGGEEAARKYQ